jgi:N-dimethylarginine dimethylaminohydrolase
MPPTRYQPLVQLVHNRAGDAFRGAIRYDADGWDALYLRDDVATEDLKAALSAIAERARANESIVPAEQYDRLGENQATVELYDRAAILHFRESQDSGIIVSLDRDVAQGLGQFVNSCNAVLAGDREADGSDG